MRLRLSACMLLVAMLVAACNNKSPEDLPKYKKKFRAQINSFEQTKEQTDDKLEDGVESLNGLQSALENAKNSDQVFRAVYGKWEKVDKQVKDLNREYEALKADAENLFGALDRQTASLKNQTTKTQLQKAIATTRGDYEATLARTAAAIEDLRKLHAEAFDVVSALEVVVALNQFEAFNEGLQHIEERVNTIMTELTSVVNESKELYDTRIGGVGGS